MDEIKRVNGQILRKELKEMEKMNAEYNTLQDKLDKLHDIIYSHNNKTQEDINILMVETNEIENVLEKLWKKLNILQLFLDIEDGEQEDCQDIELEKNGNFTILKMAIIYKKFLHRKGGKTKTFGNFGSGSYKKLEVLEKFIIETKKLPENFEAMKQNEQKNFIIENGTFQL